jgi:hypothetical protein
MLVLLEEVTAHATPPTVTLTAAPALALKFPEMVREVPALTTAGDKEATEGVAAAEKTVVWMAGRVTFISASAPLRTADILITLPAKNG